ncbi:DNA polymerase/3'-5' exonuclease PolX [Cnuella takakiae]|nr:DNA polymerase/3'-5' exonuclease PolX [Cnuella takakiae]OLY92262.1 histidinol-phosphatase [Cnuella takakiae]
MDNYAIAEQFSLLAKLMDIHGENAFKSKSYASAAFTIEKLKVDLSAIEPKQLFAIKGIGESVGQKIVQLLQTGEMDVLKELIQQTPAGVLEMMNIKGLGPKKINTLWKDLHISTIEALEAACASNNIATQKGFGVKTQEKILGSINFIKESKGKFLYAQTEAFMEAFTLKLKEAFPAAQVEPTGAYRRQLEVIDQLEWVVTIDKDELRSHLQRMGLRLQEDTGTKLVMQTEEGFVLSFHQATNDNFGTILFQTSSSTEFLEAWQAAHGLDAQASETTIFEASQKPFIPAYLRERKSIIEQTNFDASGLLQTSQIKGLIHSHSNWSDGAHTLEEMAHELIRRGFEYLVISDHSKAAFYANGLSEERIKQQHKLIDDLNKQLAPFRIFKSIECDILADGTMDYSDEVLASFDLVIASIHSNLDMEEDKAMQRLMGAITNPHVHIMGHLTGRRLLRRPSYPIDHKAIIDACAAHHVAIEINAAPERLDMDWRWIAYALEKGVLLSVNPDAHSLDDFANIKYGVLVAQKGGLTAANNISSFSRAKFEAWLGK